MDVLEIDAASFAGRVAHVSAAELAGLMQHGDVRPEPGWLTPGLDVAPDADMTPIVERMAAYVLERDAPGETLFRKFVGPSWPEASAPTQMAFDLFATTVAAVGGVIVTMQRAAEAEANQPPASPAPNVEDTIFETEEPLGTLRPEAVAAQQDLAKRQAKAAKKAEREAAAEAKAASALVGSSVLASVYLVGAEGTELQLGEIVRRAFTRSGLSAVDWNKQPDDEREEQLATELDHIETETGAKPLPKLVENTVMSAGEPPAKPPVNKGGRGKKKTAPTKE